MSHSSQGVLPPPNCRPNWTAEQNKLFENGLAIFDCEEPDRWFKIAKMVGGGTTEDEVKRQYEILQQDIDSIESGKIPLPKYKKNQGTTTKGIDNKITETKLKNLKF